MKRLLLTLVMAIGILFVSNRDSARATVGVSTSECAYAYNPGYTSALQYPCPIPTATPFVNGTSAYSAYLFGDQVGMNIHLADFEYTNLSYVQGLLQAMNIHHVREGMSIIPGNSYVINALNTLGANGIKADLVSTNGYTVSSIASIIGLLNSGDVDAVEGPNELDICCGDANWTADDKFTMMEGVSPFAKLNAPIKAIGPTTGFSSYAGLGDLSPYQDYGNTHDYDGGFYPETTGFGGAGYGGYGYGSVLYNVANAQQASISKPIIATEFGFEVNPYLQNHTDESTQGTYLLRQIFQHYLVGVPKSYIYALFDTGGQNFGLANTYTAHQRIGLSVLAGFMQIIKDSGPVSGSCVAPVTYNTGGVDSIALCKTNGESDIIFWQPAATRDPNAMTDTAFSPINVNVAPVPGFTPSSVVQWSYDLNGSWTNNPSVALSSVPVLDRPSILVINGAASPTPVPALPTPPAVATSAPTATPAPTPTPAPTATPTAVAIRQFTSVDNINHAGINVTAAFASPIQYGDYVLAGWAFHQFTASRYVISAPSILSRIAPPINAQTNLPVPIACSPITDFQGYEETCLDVWGGYVYDQAGAGSNLSWIASGGDEDSTVQYDLSGTDSTAPIAVIAGPNLAEFNTSTCPSVTAPRAGSIAICLVAQMDGGGFGPGQPNPTPNSGWIFDAEPYPFNAVTTAFHYPVTTTANQVIPAMTFTNSQTFIDYTVAETIVFQPPAH